MTRDELIKKLEELDEAIVWNDGLELTDYAREKAHINILDTINIIKENEE